MTESKIQLPRASASDLAIPEEKTSLPYPLLDQIAAVPNDGQEYQLLGRHDGLWRYSSGHSTKSAINRARGQIPPGFEVRLISKIKGHQHKSSDDPTKMVMLVIRRINTCPTCGQRVNPQESK